MGLMQGKFDGDSFIVMDAFALPVVGTETRVNAAADAYEYMVEYSTINKQPEKGKFYLRLGQSKPIYEAFNAIRNSSEWDSLSDARKRVVEGQIKDAVLGGVALEDEHREKFNQIQQELEKLTEKFSETFSTR